MNPAQHHWPEQNRVRSLRWLLPLAVLGLCSCRGPGMRSGPSLAPPEGLPVDAQAAAAGAFAMAEDPCPPPLPCNMSSQWMPPGMVGPWPTDEYLRNGCDKLEPVEVSPDWEVQGLNVKDTVAHYDSIDGQTLVCQSNCVHLYAPRFGAVRTVLRATEGEALEKSGGVHQPTRTVWYGDVKQPLARAQPQQPIGQIAHVPPLAVNRRQGDEIMSIALGPRGFQDRFSTYENLKYIKAGLHDNSEKARLAEAACAALVWSRDQAVQVMLDRVQAHVETKDVQPLAVYTVKDERCCPRLCVLKVASTDTAKPGETVDFTIRFDNVGDQPIGNIVLVDNLTTRLEYVPDSAQSSVEAHFSSQANEVQSLVLRWEIDKPLAPGDGGLVRFRCKVR